jgi:hypothetical protein
MFNLFNKINFLEIAYKIVDESRSFMSTTHYRVLKKNFDYILCGELEKYSCESYKGECIGIKMHPNKMECYIIRIKYLSLEYDRMEKWIKVISKSKFYLNHQDDLYKKIINKIDKISIHNSKKDLNQTIYLYNEDLLKKENEIAKILKEIKEVKDAEQNWNNENGVNEKISMTNVINDKENEIKKLLKDKMRFETIIKESKMKLENINLDFDKGINNTDELLKVFIYGTDDK